MGYYDVTLRGVTFDGSSAPAPIKIHDGGIDGLASVLVRSSRVPLSGADGAYGGPDFQRERTIRIPLALESDGATSVWEQLDIVSEAFAPGSTDVPLTVCLPGIPTTGETLTLFGRPEGIVDDGLNAYSADLIRCFGVFTALDPYKYGPEEVDTVAPAATEEIINDGNVASRRWGVSIPTGAVNPTVNGETGIVDFAAYTVSTNPVLLNGRTRTALQNAVSKYTEITQPFTWPKLQPGGNDWTYTNDGGASAITITWRSAWR